MRQHANFFKHGDRQEEETIFFPAITEAYLMFAVLGVSDCGLPYTQQELTFLFWIHVNRPEALTEFGSNMVNQHLTVERLAELRATPKHEFYKIISGLN
jgi:hypothetical protein